jgi:hypothetical protein
MAATGYGGKPINPASRTARFLLKCLKKFLAESDMTGAEAGQAHNNVG